MRLPWRCPSGPGERKLIAYAKYLVIWLLAGTIHPRADTLLLSHYVTNLGFYAAAAQLSLVVPMLTQSVNMVLMPRISALRTTSELQGALASASWGRSRLSRY